jgi:hypothetical protein
VRIVHGRHAFHDTTYTESRERPCESVTVGVRSACVAKIKIQQFRTKACRAGRRPAAWCGFVMFVLLWSHLNNHMMSFVQYVRMPEGLWLADKHAVPGMSNVNPLIARKSRTKQSKPSGNGTHQKAIKLPNPFHPTV